MTVGRPSFASDNHAGVHPEVFDAMLAANTGHAPAYGADAVTERARTLFGRHFGDDIEVLFVFNGTGANVVGLQTMMRPFESIICADTAHINVDECGAPERFLGSKLTDVPTPDGKLTTALLDEVAPGAGDQHHVQPRVVSVTQPTELGTVYTPDQIAALAEWAHRHDMLLHVDGARLANAAVSLDCGLGDLGAPLGVDVMSFGATKNGAMGAEAVILFGADDRVRRSPFIRKQAMQLASKMRFVSAQFVALLESDLWRVNAAHANRMAQRLATGVRGVAGVDIAHPVQANAVFASLPTDEAIAAQQAHYPFYVWNAQRRQVRWMTSFDTAESDVDDFVARLADSLGQAA
jgi:threonine aldolase